MKDKKKIIIFSLTGVVLVVLVGAIALFVGKGEMTSGTPNQQEVVSSNTIKSEDVVPTAEPTPVVTEAPTAEPTSVPTPTTETTQTPNEGGSGDVVEAFTWTEEDNSYTGKVFLAMTDTKLVSEPRDGADVISDVARDATFVFEKATFADGKELSYVKVNVNGVSAFISKAHIIPAEYVNPTTPDVPQTTQTPDGVQPTQAPADVTPTPTPTPSANPSGGGGTQPTPTPAPTVKPAETTPQPTVDPAFEDWLKKQQEKRDAYVDNDGNKYDPETGELIDDKSIDDLVIPDDFIVR